MVWFERFTLCCVVIVIASLSCMLIASVQLVHRLEDGVNRDNGALLQKLAMLRMAQTPAHGPVTSCDPLLAVIVRSSKRNNDLRRTIRRTWARSDRRIVHRFMLRSSSSDTYPRHDRIDDEGLTVWLQRLHRRRIEHATAARYFLLVDEHVFVNTRFLLEAIERVLPTEGFILCSLLTGGHGREICDPSKPILLTADIARGSTKPYTVHDGKRLYLSRLETEALLRQQVDNVSEMTFFFTASLDRVTSTSLLTPAIQRLWMGTVANYTSVEC